MNKKTIKGDDKFSHSENTSHGDRMYPLGNEPKPRVLPSDHDEAASIDNDPTSSDPTHKTIMDIQKEMGQLPPESRAREEGPYGLYEEGYDNKGQNQ